jgi:flagellar capping protein FliD
MNDLKKKYNQLFAGKPKSNDSDLLNEGTYLFGIATSKKPIKEADDDGMISAEEFGGILDQIADIYDQLYSVQEQLDTLSNDALSATGLSIYRDMNAQTSRYIKAVEAQLENLTKYLERTQQRIGRV